MKPTPQKTSSKVSTPPPAGKKLPFKEAKKIVHKDFPQTMTKLAK